MKDAPLCSLMVASSESGICWPFGVGTSRLPISLRVRAVLRLHADDEVEKFFALDDLRRGLAANCGLDDHSDVGDIDSVARDFGAVDVYDQAGLAEFADDGELREAGRAIEYVADFDGLFLQHVEVGAEDFYR